MATSINQAQGPDTRFDRRFWEILDYATEVFAEKGYEGASMRDLSRLSGMSLAGLYYYFDSKEKLLYEIQKHTFTTIVERLRERLATSTDREERIRIFVSNHVDYAVARQNAMKVLSHEDDVLKGASLWSRNSWSRTLWNGRGRTRRRKAVFRPAPRLWACSA
jgi:AcrR family transcriptional regulator